MANRMKEDEKNEKIIRGLLKQPGNRRCINCNSLGPQYVCTNFWTFVCTNCSGIHREFTHRVKSVSMAKFTSQEVSALQAGGNAHAKEIYFKEWDSHHHSFPDSSNVERLRDFIKHVYEDRRYTGERSVDKPPRVNMGDRDDTYENRRADTYRGGSGSPPYEDKSDGRYGERSVPGGRNDDRNFRYNYDERRSPGYDQESQRYGAYRKSPVRFEVVDDRRRDDRFGNGRRSEDHRFSDGESKMDGRSPNHKRGMDMSSPPMVRPVRDILGENAPPLRVIEPPKANGSRIGDASGHTQRTASSSSLGSVEGNSVELKRENLGSLIDFDADPEPPPPVAAPQIQTQATMSQSVQQPTTSATDGGNWASFDFASPANASQAPSNANTLESVLSQLSAPAPVIANKIPTLPNSASTPITASVGNMSTLPISSGAPYASVGHVSMFPITGGAPATTLANNMSTILPGSGAPASTPGGNMSMFPMGSGDSFINANDLGQWPKVQQHQPSFFPSTDNHSNAQQFTPSIGGNLNNQPWSSSLAPNAQEPLNTPNVQSYHAVSKPKEDNSFGVVSQTLPFEAKSSGRGALPEDLFAANYSSVPGSVPGWQTVPPRGMGLGMQYPTAVPVPTFPHLSRSINPFDLNNESTPVPTSMFPSMVSLQGALPNVSAPTGLMRIPSLSTPSSRLMPPQSPSYSLALPPQSSPYASAMPPQSPPYASALPPSAYMGQQLPSNMPPFGHQAAGGFGGDGAVFSTLNTNQPLAGRYSAPATPHSFASIGGNPFG